MEISVKHDLARLSKDLSKVQRRAVPKAAQQSLNRAAASARGVAVKAISKESGIKQKAVRSATALRKARLGNLTARIEARGRPLNLIRFQARQLKKGLRAKPWGKRRLYKRRVFIANRGRTVFIREAGGRKIRGMFGASIARELVRKEARSALGKQFRLRWPIEFERALNNELRKLGFK